MSEISPVFKTTKPLILASGSPRRQDFLREIGLEFEVVCREVDEAPLDGELPEAYVARLAYAKAMAVACDFPENVVVGADTAVVLGSEILGKPRDDGHGLQMLKQLRGRWHDVITGFAVVYGGQHEVEAVTSGVAFHDFADEVLGAYAVSGDGRDKAGGYGMQSGGAFLVKEVKGSFSNVIGLPMTEMIQMLLRFEAIEPGCTS